MNDTKSDRTREILLQAANQVLLTHGINRLTLEAVAGEAGMSKGGLLYHFPSKEALIEGMVDYYLIRFEQRLMAKLTAEPEPESPLAWLRAYIHATFDEDSQETAISSGLLAAVAINPQLLAPLQARYQIWQERFASSTDDRALATIIRLALDGLWVSQMFGLASPDAALRGQVLARLLQLLQE
jgi:AcrR family transcriptional regulator